MDGKPLMKLVMNPRGKVQDWHTFKSTGMYNEHEALSPEICHDIVRDLQSPKGKGRYKIVVQVLSSH